MKLKKNSSLNSTSQKLVYPTAFRYSDQKSTVHKTKLSDNLN